MTGAQVLEWSVAENKGKEAPQPRSRHAMEWCKASNSLYVFGGADDKQDFAGVWVYSLDTKCWTNASTTGPAPCARWGLSACAVKDKIYVFGGNQSSGTPDDQATLGLLYSLDVTTLKWEIIKAIPNSPPPRAGHTCNVFGDRYICIFGGGDGCQLFNDMYVFDSISCEWISLPIHSLTSIVPLHPRWAHSAIAWDGQLIIYGGANGPIAYGEVISISVDLLVARLMIERFGGSLDSSAFVTLPYLLDEPNSSEKDGSRKHSGSAGRAKSDALLFWLRSLGVEEYAHTFLNENITMRMVPFLTEEHLEEIGVDSLSARLTILSGIQQFKLMNNHPNANPMESGISMATVLGELAKAVDKLQQSLDSNNKDL